jgi:hypothetical protein
MSGRLLITGVDVYSYDPRRWYSVSQPNIAVVERGRPAEFVPTIIVNDQPQIAPSVGCPRR